MKGEIVICELLFSPPGKRELSRDSVHCLLGVYRLPDGYRHLNTDYFLEENKKTICRD